MLLPKSLFSFLERHAFTAVGLFHALSYCGDRLGVLQPVEHQLIALGVLHHELGSAVYGQDERSLFLLEPANVIFDVALELSHRTDFSEVDHGWNPLACLKQTIPR